MRLPFSPRPGRSLVLNPNRQGERPAALTAAGGLTAAGLTAAGTRVSKQNADQMRRLVQAWQSRALAYYDMCGEIKFAAQFYSRMLTPLQLFAGELIQDDDGLYSVEPTKNDVVVAQVERLQDPGGGRNGLLGSYGRLMFLTGEAYLFCSIGDDDTEQWEVLSTDELSIMGDSYVRYWSPTLQPKTYKEAKNPDRLQKNEAVAIRVWQRHPRWSGLSDSTMFGVLDIVEELLLLTSTVRARAKSRMAGSGILFIDENITTRPVEPVPDEDPEEDPFIVDLTQAMTAPIKDEGVASSVVPLVVRVSPPEAKEGQPVPISDLVYHLQLVDPTQLYPETGLRMECLRRIAIGLDMPPEVLLGTADVNHWGGWLVDEQTWKSHGQQKAQQLCDDLTSSFLRPTLKELKVADWAKYVVGFDASAVINHPSRSLDAKDLYDRRAIGKQALREANAFTDDDEPTEDELAEMIGVAVHDGALAVTGIPTLKETAGGGAGAEAEATAQEEEATGVKPEEVVKQQPPERPTAEGEPVSTVGSANGELSWQIIGAAQLALLRSREVAGNRIKSYAKRDPAEEKAIQGVPARNVAAVLGQATVRALGCPPEATLVSGARSLCEDALALWGITGREADRLCAMIERHAIKTLYDEHPAPLPATFTNLAATIHAR